MSLRQNWLNTEVEPLPYSYLHVQSMQGFSHPHLVNIFIEGKICQEITSEHGNLNPIQLPQLHYN